ncbi:MAG TPA: TetR family transcriptional regulator [Streptosporangiaceae bacterium]
MPTGIAIRDAREQLFTAAERVLFRAGPSGLTSRAVTAEAAVAKGVMHRHFSDFDGFLAEFAMDRIRVLEGEAARLRESAGTGTVIGNLTAVLADLFGSAVLPLIALILSRDELRNRLRQAGAGRVPVAAQAAAMVASYLAAERDLGRIAADADVETLGPMLVGTGHLQFAGREATPPEAAAIRRGVIAVIASVLPDS